MTPHPLPVRAAGAVVLVCATVLLLAPTVRAAEYVAFATAQFLLTDLNGDPLGGDIVDQFTEGETLAETQGPGEAFASAEFAVDALGTGVVDGFSLVFGAASGGSAQSRALTRWLGAVEVSSADPITVLASVAQFWTLAGRVDAPEEVASASVAIDLVVANVDEGCLDRRAVGTRGVEVTCFDVIERIPIDAASRVALPNFLDHTTVPGDQSVGLTIEVDLAAQVGGAAARARRGAAPPFVGVLSSHVIDVPDGTPLFIGLEARSDGEALVTDTPHCFGEPATLVGTEDDDRLTGTDGPDVILGLGGNDRIRSLDGDDLVCAGDGDDDVKGGDDDDQIAGEDGDDSLDGERDDDVVLGGDGDDDVRGGRDDDLLEGGAGDDDMKGERGDDVMLGGTGDDEMNGGPGDDALLGGQDVLIDIDIDVDLGGLADGGGGPTFEIDFSTPDDTDDDELNGSRNDDVVDGGPGDDEVKGGKGNDVVSGGFGTDEVNGGGGSADVCTDPDDDPGIFTGCEDL